MMKKLGFAIQVTSTGARTPMVWNPEAWSSKVIDVREHIKLFDGLLGTDNSVTFLSFDERGCFITIMRTIPGRDTDFNSGWIYIPSNLDIAVENVMDAHKFVRERILTKSNISDIKPEIDEFFGKEYPQKEIYSKYEPSHGDAFAIRYLVRYNMKELLKDRYQPYYANYKAIFLLDKEGEVKIVNGYLVEDLTSKELLKQAVVTPPSSNDLKECGEGTKLLIDGKEFSKPIIAYVGETKELVLTRAGFEKQSCSSIIREDTKVTLSSSQILARWKKRISASMFVVCDERGNRIGRGLKIEVNGKDVSFQDILFSEEDCKHAHVKITWKESYETYVSQQVNLLEPIHPISLKRENKAFKSKVVMKNGEMGDMTIDSKYLPIENKSPLEGYYLDKNRNLQLDWLFVWKQRLYGVLIVAGIVLLVAVCNVVETWYNDHNFVRRSPFIIEKVRNEKVSNDPQSKVHDVDPQTGGEDEGNNDREGEPEGVSDADAIAYMNGNGQWIEAELEKYELTKGLYAEINQYQFDRIVSWEIEDCARFESIKSLSQEMKDLNITMLGGIYSNDGSITVEMWLKKVSNRKQEIVQERQGQNNNMRATGSQRPGNVANTNGGKNGNDSNNQGVNGGL